MGAWGVFEGRHTRGMLPVGNLRNLQGDVSEGCRLRGVRSWVTRMVEGGVEGDEQATMVAMGGGYGLADIR